MRRSRYYEKMPLTPPLSRAPSPHLLAAPQPQRPSSPYWLQVPEHDARSPSPDRYEPPRSPSLGWSRYPSPDTDVPPLTPPPRSLSPNTPEVVVSAADDERLLPLHIEIDDDDPSSCQKAFVLVMRMSLAFMLAAIPTSLVLFATKSYFAQKDA